MDRFQLNVVTPSFTLFQCSFVLQLALTPETNMGQAVVTSTFSMLHFKEQLGKKNQNKNLNRN